MTPRWMRMRCSEKEIQDLSTNIQTETKVSVSYTNISNGRTPLPQANQPMSVIATPKRR